MNRMKILLLIFFSALLNSCSTPAYVEKADNVNLGSYSTYMWVDTRAKEDDETKRATAYVDLSVHNAVNAQLAKWGWKETTENPDVLVSYDVLVERATETNREAVYSQPYSRVFFNPYTRRWTTLYYPSQFQGYEVYDTPVREGTVTITVIDAKTDKSIWQGWTTRRLDASRITDEEIESSVRSIFKKGS